jgi:hypothetical protein
MLGLRHSHSIVCSCIRLFKAMLPCCTHSQHFLVSLCCIRVSTANISVPECCIQFIVRDVLFAVCAVLATVAASSACC